MRVYYSDHYRVPLPANHRFPMDKYRRIREELLARGVLFASQLHQAEPVGNADLLRVHRADYLAAILGGSLSSAQERQIGFPWSAELVLRSRASVGGTLAAARSALLDGVGGNLAGGTHHASASRGEGYCVFNDIAIAIRALQADRLIRRAIVVDLDVHQGNGTAEIFEGDETVFTFSMHGERNFPFRKARSSLDVGLADGTGDEVYLDALSRHLTAVLEVAGADLVFYQAGVDPLEGDALGRLALSLDGLEARDEMVLRFVRARGLPIVLTLGGGYAKPIERSVEAHVATYRMAALICGGRR